MLSITSKIEEITKLTKPQIGALKKLGLFTVKDLLLHLPYRYLDFSKTVKISDLKPGENVSLKVIIKSINARFSFRSRMSLCEALVSDDTGSIKIVWFNQGYLAKTLNKGEEIFLAGTAEIYKNSLQINNPIYEKVSSFPVHTSRLVPVYHLKSGLYPRTIRNLIKFALPLAKQILDDLPAEIIKNQSLPNLSNTITISHFPEKLEQVILAKKRLAFEEIFYNQLAAQKYKIELLQKPGFQIPFKQDLVKQFVDSLPFKLTAEQKKASWEILQDLEKTTPMNRLLEGDVGSGKTLVALIAALETISNEFQVVFLAPTEILAKQHFETALRFLKIKNLKLKIILLTNSYSKINNEDIPKIQLKKLISNGMPGLYIGTHALLQKTVKFKNLALVIVDEQHRFGVEQRAHLIKTYKKTPHLLSLSATPIPRTLQLAFFGELDISQITEKPIGRKPIITKLVAEENRNKAYEFILKEIEKNRQVFVITPLIEESDKLGVKSAKKEQELLQKAFPKLQIGLLHGQLKGKAKEEVMGEFLSNNTQILVATSVVEVGVDVPNASVMIIEGAERFGLSQLHQFRGRVGRAEHQSYCFLFQTPPNLPLLRGGITQNFPPLQGGIKGGLNNKIQKQDSSFHGNDSLERLQAFCKTQNGFELAETDLKQRGFGDMYGSVQSGWNFKYFDLSYTTLIEPAREEAKKILENDIDLKTFPTLKEKIKNKIIHFE